MMSEQHSYNEIPHYSPAEVTAAIQKDDPEQLSRVVIGVSLYAPDLRYAEDLCVRLTAHQNFNVRGNAVLGLGHLARRFGQLDRTRAKPIIELALRDESEYARGQAWAAAEDVTHFLGWSIEGFDEEA